MGRLQKILQGNDGPLFDYFRQLGEHIGFAGEEFLALARDFEHAEAHAQTLHTIEHRCDAVMENLFNFLYENTFLAIDHEDIKELAGLSDDIVDLLWGAANRIGNIYQLSDPDPELIEIAQILFDMTQKTQILLGGLKHAKRQKNFKKEVIIPFRQAESRADELRDKISRLRFKIAESDPPATPHWIAWSEVMQHLEHATDKCVDITDILSHFQSKYK